MSMYGREAPEHQLRGFFFWFVEACDGVGDVDDFAAEVDGFERGGQHTAFRHDAGEHQTAAGRCDIEGGFSGLRHFHE